MIEPLRERSVAASYNPALALCKNDHYRRKSIGAVERQRVFGDVWAAASRVVSACDLTLSSVWCYGCDDSTVKKEIPCKIQILIRPASL
jgi:hypothetical protein